MSSNEEIINYVMSTPENANPNVLRGMLENGSEGSGGDFKSIELLRWTEFGEWTKKSQGETEEIWECSLGTVPVDQFGSIDIVFGAPCIVGEIPGQVKKDFVWVDAERLQISFSHKPSDLWWFYLVFEEVDETLEVKLRTSVSNPWTTDPDLEAVILYIIRPVDESEESGDVETK